MFLKKANRYASQPQMPQGNPQFNGMTPMGGQINVSRMTGVGMNSNIAQAANAGMANPNPLTQVTPGKHGLATAGGIQQAAQNAGMQPAQPTQNPAPMMPKMGGVNPDNPFLRARDNWLEGLIPVFKAQVKAAEVATGGNMSPTSSPNSLGSGSQSASTGVGNPGMGTPAGRPGAQNQQGQMGGAGGAGGGTGLLGGNQGPGGQVGAFGIVQPGWNSLRPSAPALGGVTRPGTGLTKAGMMPAGGPTPGLTANQPVPQPGMAPPPPGMPAMPPPNGGAPIPGAPGQPSVDPMSGQPLPPTVNGQPAPPPGQDPAAQGAAPPQGPPPPMDPMTGQPVSSPMSDPPPPTLPGNPRMLPPRPPQPSDHAQAGTMSDLMGDKRQADLPGSPGEALDDVQSQAAAMGSKTAGDYRTRLVGELVAALPKSTFEKAANPAAPAVLARLGGLGRAVREYVGGRAMADVNKMPRANLPKFDALGEEATHLARQRLASRLTGGLADKPGVHLQDRAVGGVLGGAGGVAADDRVGGHEGATGVARRVGAGLAGAAAGGKALNAGLNVARRYVSNTSPLFGYEVGQVPKLSLRGVWRHGVKDQRAVNPANTDVEREFAPGGEARYELLRRYLGVHRPDAAKDFFVKNPDGSLRFNPATVKPDSPLGTHLTDELRRHLPKPTSDAPYSNWSRNNPLRSVLGSHDTRLDGVERAAGGMVSRRTVGDAWNFAVDPHEKPVIRNYLGGLLRTSPGRVREYLRQPDVLGHNNPDGTVGGVLSAAGLRQVMEKVLRQRTPVVRQQVVSHYPDNAWREPTHKLAADLEKDAGLGQMLAPWLIGAAEMTGVGASLAGKSVGPDVPHPVNPVQRTPAQAPRAAPLPPRPPIQPTRGVRLSRLPGGRFGMLAAGLGAVGLPALLGKQSGDYAFDAEDCPKCGASMEGDSYTGTCNSCQHKWGTKAAYVAMTPFARGFFEHCDALGVDPAAAVEKVGSDYGAEARDELRDGLEKLAWGSALRAGGGWVMQQGERFLPGATNFARGLFGGAKPIPLPGAAAASPHAGGAWSTVAQNAGRAAPLAASPAMRAGNAVNRTVGAGWNAIPGGARGQVAGSAGGALLGGFGGDSTPFDTGSTWGNAAVGAAAFNPYLNRMVGGTRGLGALGNPVTRGVQGGLLGAGGGYGLDMVAGWAGMKDANGNPTTNFGRMGGTLGTLAGGVGGAGRAMRQLGTAGGTINRTGQKMMAFGEGALTPIRAPFQAIGRMTGHLPAGAAPAGRFAQHANYGRLAGLGTTGVLGVHQGIEGLRGVARDFVGREAVPFARDQAAQFADEYIGSRLPHLQESVNEHLGNLGLLGADGRFNPLAGVGQRLGGGVDSIFQSLGMDPSRMSPLQKMMILGGAGIGGVGAAAGSPVMAGLGGVGAMAGLLPQFMPGQGQQRLNQQYQPGQQPQGGQPGQPQGPNSTPPNTPQARNEWLVQQQANGGM